ncbi:MAG TPA: Ig-like domain-containing protein, partial [Blastocatellia bacterium]|nr:Ig-like domain-containing protein [Blastocatellia bacterium]
MTLRTVLLPVIGVCLGLCLALDAFLPISKGSRVNAATSESEMPKGLQFRLSEGSEQPNQTARLPVAPASPLSDAATAAVLARLTPIKAADNDQTDFALRDRSLPPPRTGETIHQAFPPRENATAPEGQTASGPLEVLRYAPEGDVPIAPHLSVTFSQPMVDVTSQEQAAQRVPVELSPSTPGKWRWVGTKTVLFEPDGRFPMATKYKATVPAGTRAALGQPLPSAKTWEFNTPPVELKTSYPGNRSTQRRDPLMFVECNQRINPEALIQKIRITSGRSAWTAKLASSQEVEANSEIKYLAKNAVAGRWLAFRVTPHTGSDPKFPLPADSDVTVTLEAGAPSAEGPRLTESPQTFSFHTYGALHIVEHRCGYDGCHPFDPWEIRFNNPLDQDAFDSSQIKVVPELPGLKTSIYSDTLQIEGASRGRTAYHVTVSGTIKDQFGQTLAKNETVSFDVGQADPVVYAPKEGLIVADPFSLPRFSVYSINYQSLKVTLYSVAPDDWAQFGKFMSFRDGYNRDEAKVAPPGRLIESKTIPVESRPDEVVETRINLSPGLKDGHGHVVVLVEAPTTAAPAAASQRGRRRPRRESVCAWVQVTGIGLDAFVDDSDMLAWATSLKDGKPLDGVALGLSPRSRSNAITNTDGIAHLPLLSSPGGGPTLLIAHRGSDVAILPRSSQWWSQDQGWQRVTEKDALRWYVFDDRQMYRPGEEVHLKGWIRRIGAGKSGDVGAVDGAVGSVSYVVKDSRGNEVLKGALKVNALSGFDTAFKLPDTMNLGYCSVVLNSETGAQFDGESYTHQFQVQEFRRPEFEVSATGSDGPHFVGGTANVTVSAQYYAGGPLPEADVNWRVTSTPGAFTPPNRSDYTFGEW